MAYDLILRGGRVIDRSQHLDAAADVVFAAGKVARVGLRLDAGPATDIPRRERGALWCPARSTAA
jgi:dihydroorotase